MPPSRSSGYHVSRLSNGLTLATAEMPHMMSVSVGIWVGVGSRYEPAPLNGICHFIEHLLFKGTRRRSASDIAEAVEGIGGSINAYTSEETTCFHARAGADHFEDVLDVLLDMLLESKFAPPDISKERNVIKEEIAMYLDEPQHHVQELLNSTMWPRQPLGRSITGTPKTLDGMRRAELVDFLKKHYTPANTMIVAAGKVSHRRLARAVARYEGRFGAPFQLGFAPCEPRQTAPGIALVSKETEQTQIALGIRTCSRHDSQRYALRLINALLGENSSSRLFQSIREDRGLAYSIYSSPSLFHDTGDLVISAGLDANNVNQTLRLVLRELRRLAATPVSARELRRAQEYVIGQFDLGLESTEGRMNWLGEQLAGYGRIFDAGQIKRRLLAVTAAEMRAVAAEYFRPERMSLALVSPRKSTRDLMGLFRREFGGN
jgi:predicted Zn-dependent peptidase